MPSEQLPKDSQLVKAWEEVNALVEFAYEQGFHELGYNPLNVIDSAMADLRASLRREENAVKVMAEENTILRTGRNQWKERAERICGLVLKLNTDEGLSAGALAGLQRLANAALGKQS